MRSEPLGFFTNNQKRLPLSSESVWYKTCYSTRLWSIDVTQHFLNFPWTSHSFLLTSVIIWVCQKRCFRMSLTQFEVFGFCKWVFSDFHSNACSGWLVFSDDGITRSWESNCPQLGPFHGKTMSLFFVISCYTFDHIFKMCSDNIYCIINNTSFSLIPVIHIANLWDLINYSLLHISSIVIIITFKKNIEMNNSTSVLISVFSNSFQLH